jgi:hypothetical protein
MVGRRRRRRRVRKVAPSVVSQVGEALGGKIKTAGVAGLSVEGVHLALERGHFAQGRAGLLQGAVRPPNARGPARAIHALYGPL